MRRRLFTLTSAMSLLMCLATVVLWVRSYWVFDLVNVHRRTSLTWWKLTSQRGNVQTLRWGLTPVAMAHWKGHVSDDLSLESTPVEVSGYDWFKQPDLRWRIFGFGYRSDDMGGPAYSATYVYQGVKMRSVSIPDWLPALLASILPLIWLRAQAHAIRSGHCRRCSYDLTGNTSGVCPECGTAVTIPN